MLEHFVTRGLHVCMKRRRASLECVSTCGGSPVPSARPLLACSQAIRMGRLRLTKSVCLSAFLEFTLHQSRVLLRQNGQGPGRSVQFFSYLWQTGPRNLRPGYAEVSGVFARRPANGLRARPSPQEVGRWKGKVVSSKYDTDEPAESTHLDTRNSARKTVRTRTLHISRNPRFYHHSRSTLPRNSQGTKTL